MADLAQLVRALVCGTRCREFESHNPPHKKAVRKGGLFMETADTETRTHRSEFDSKLFQRHCWQFEGRIFCDFAQFLFVSLVTLFCFFIFV